MWILDAQFSIQLDSVCRLNVSAGSHTSRPTQPVSAWGGICQFLSPCAMLWSSALNVCWLVDVLLCHNIRFYHAWIPIFTINIYSVFFACQCHDFWGCVLWDEPVKHCLSVYLWKCHDPTGLNVNPGDHPILVVSCFCVRCLYIPLTSLNLKCWHHQLSSFFAILFIVGDRQL